MSLIERHVSRLRARRAVREQRPRSPWKVASRHAIALEPRLVFDGSLPATLTEGATSTLHTHTGANTSGNSTPFAPDQAGDVVLGTATLTNGNRVVLWGTLANNKFPYPGGKYNGFHAGYSYYTQVNTIELSIIDTSGSVTTNSVSFSGANDPTNIGNGISIVLTSMNDGGFVIAEDVINGDSSAYSNSGGFGNGNIYYQVYDNSAAIVKAWTQLNQTAGDTSEANGGSNGYVVLAPGPTGFIAAWTEKNMDVYFERFSNLGVSTSSIVHVGVTGGTTTEYASDNIYVDGQGDVLTPWSSGNAFLSDGFKIYSPSNTLLVDATWGTTLDSGMVSGTPNTSSYFAPTSYDGGQYWVPMASGFAAVFGIPTSGNWNTTYTLSFNFQEVTVSGSTVSYGSVTNLITNSSTHATFYGTMLTDGNILYQVTQGSSAPAYWELAPSAPGTHTTPISITDPSGGTIASIDNMPWVAMSPISGGGVFAAIQKSASGHSYYGYPLDSSLYVADFGGSGGGGSADTAPSFSGGGNTTSFTEGGSAITLNSGLSVSDTELNTAGNYAGAELVVARHGGANASDVFAMASGVTLSGGTVTAGATNVGTYTNTGGTLTIDFNASATQTLVNTVLDHITYSDSSIGPPASVQIDWSLNDGNAGAQGTGGAMTGTTSTTVNTVVPAPSTPDMTAGTDTGASSTDNLTKDTTPTFTGTGLNGETVKLYDGATQVGSAVVSSGAWSITASTLSEGSHTITATQTDTNSNVSSSSGSLTVNIDTTPDSAPTVTGITSGTDSGVKGDGITSNTQPTITGTGVNGDVVTVKDGASTLGTATVSAGTWSLALASPLSESSHSITATQTDAAGNASSASGAFTLVIDKTAPSQPGAPTVAPATDSGTKGDGITNIAKPLLKGTTEANATVSVYDNGSLLGTATADGTGAWHYIVPSTLSDGTHPITIKATDAAGNTSSASSALSLTIDTSAPAAPSVGGILGASDSGTKGDGITNVSSPYVKGTAEANATVAVYSDGGYIGTATADGSGAWLLHSPGLADGAHAITAYATDAAGNASGYSGAYSLTIDTHAPAAPTVSGILAATDSGVKGDGITAIAAPYLKGTAEANAKVQVYADGGYIGTTTADGSGNWLLHSPGLADGAHAITAYAADAAGNASGYSGAFSLTIDTHAPAAPSTPALAPASDTGTLGDGMTSVTKPTFTGTAEANSTVYVYSDGGLLGVTTADGSGAWSFLDPTPLSVGKHQITAIASDKATNTSAASTAFSLTITGP